MPEPGRQPVIAIFGPTGAGKTACAIDLALRFGGEVVNADSRYLYRRLAIGVAKPTLAERRGVPHYLIDLFDPDEFITIAQVQKLALAAITDIHERSRLPILVGGTPLYMNAITEGWQIPEVAPDWEFRRAIERRIEREGLAAVVAELASIDPAAAVRSGSNPRRVIRALEIYHRTGSPMSSLEGRTPPPFSILKLALSRSRPELYADLDARVDRQIEEGLIEEVGALLASGLTGTEPAFSAIGYRQLLPYLAGDISLADAVASIKHDTHRYVRHQLTWLRRANDLVWFDTSQPGWDARVRDSVETWLADIRTDEP
jgi:tRNA dimethylallyltransferase